MVDRTQCDHHLFAGLKRMIRSFTREIESESTDGNRIARIGIVVAQPRFHVNPFGVGVIGGVRAQTDAVEILHLVRIVVERKILIVIVIGAARRLGQVEIDLFQDNGSLIRGGKFGGKRFDLLVVARQHDILRGRQDLDGPFHLDLLAHDYAIRAVFGFEARHALRIGHRRQDNTRLRISQHDLEIAFRLGSQRFGQRNAHFDLLAALEKFAVLHVFQAAAQQKGGRQG